MGRWYLPPSVPEKPCEVEDCDPFQDWKSREDDQPHIVKDRLEVYHQHMDPILEYFERHDRLLKLTPYKGYDDIPEIIDDIYSKKDADALSGQEAYDICEELQDDWHDRRRDRYRLAFSVVARS